MTQMDTFGVFLLVVASILLNFGCSKTVDHFNVMDFGAKSDGQTDDSEAFLGAWNAACNASVQNPTVIVPPKRAFLVNPIMFYGPCKASNINFMISGKIMAPESAKLWEGSDASQWLGFKDVKGLVVDGSGTIDGRGKSWWDQSCRYHPTLIKCTRLAPTALKFISCSEGSLSNLKLINSAQTHISVRGCSHFHIDNVHIKSPGNSPNTDGIHIQSSNNVIISNSKIASGDDCISIGDHIYDIQVSQIECGPGHGISIGSLGKSGNYVQVEKIRVSNSLFNGTTNGARIKTWQVGRGYVRDVRFENLTFHNVKNPIIIDQNYCSVKNACKEQKTGVAISNVIYEELYGSSKTAVAINLNCSRNVPCLGLTMESIKLTATRAGKKVYAKCANAHGQEHNVVPASCMLPQ